MEWKKKEKNVFLPGKFSFAQKFLEWSISRSESFIDFYGPYKIKEDQALVFAQQLEYNKDICSGEYDVKARIYQESDIVVENEFEEIGSIPNVYPRRNVRGDGVLHLYRRK